MTLCVEWIRKCTMKELRDLLVPEEMGLWVTNGKLDNVANHSLLPT
jgi:hypothetical protein